MIYNDLYIYIFLPLGLVTHNSQLTGTMGAAARFTGLHWASLGACGGHWFLSNMVTD